MNFLLERHRGRFECTDASNYPRNSSTSSNPRTLAPDLVRPAPATTSGRRLQFGVGPRPRRGSASVRAHSRSPRAGSPPTPVWPQARRMYVSTEAIWSSVSDAPSGGIRPIGPSLPPSKIRVVGGTDPRRVTNADSTRFAPSLSRPRPSSWWQPTHVFLYEPAPAANRFCCSARQRRRRHDWRRTARPVELGEHARAASLGARRRARGDAASAAGSARQGHPAPRTNATATAGTLRPGKPDASAAATSTPGRAGRGQRRRRGPGAAPSARHAGLRRV